MKIRAALTLSLLAAGGVGASAAAVASQAGARDWVIGPIIGARNYSVGMPTRPTPLPGGGLQIDLPRAPGSVHYVTFPHGSLAGKRRIVMRYRVQAAPGVRIEPTTAPHMNSMITLYFQRAGDNWKARGPFEAYRWYATFATHSPMKAGEYLMVAPLDANWTAVQTSKAHSSRGAFQAALANADQVGFVLGGGDGFGHGVHATGPARLIVTEFRVE